MIPVEEKEPTLYFSERFTRALVGAAPLPRPEFHFVSGGITANYAEIAQISTGWRIFRRFTRLPDDHQEKT